MKRLLPLCLFTLLTAFSFAQNIYPDYTDGKVYVKMTRSALSAVLKEDPRNIPTAKLVALKDIVTKYGVTRIHKPFFQAADSRELPFILKLEFSATAKVNDLIRDLERVVGVEYAEKVPLMKTDIVPNDPVFPAHLTQINAVNAWNVFNGNSNITVAIVDNAVMWTHSDLVANTFTNTAEIAGNNIDDDGNGYVDDRNGYDVADLDNNPEPTNVAMDHGTHCAGIAGAVTNNSAGIASIGWNIKIIPVKTQTDLGSTTGIAAGYEGIVYAANAYARVISCSWGGAGAAISEQAVINYAWNKGCIVIAAAGNSNSTTQNYPGAYNNVYCVASVSSADVKSGFSNYGTWVDISAPGENVYSTTPSATTGTFLTYSGTSMATPLVAGLAGLMLSKCSFMTQTDVLNCISSTAVNIYTLAGNSTYASPQRLGAGRIDAFAAMNCASTFTAIPPIANFRTPTRNTCPATPVQFYDSSQYAPTSWAWVFQGGSPATSTLANPIVQWATPGTYSVMLTVSNANGSDPETKLAYITVAGPIALPLQEGFQAATFLPANWTQNNILNDMIYWERETGVGGFGTSTACAMFDNYNINALNERDEMRTPKYDFTNVGSARLRFDVAYARYSSFYTDTLEVKISTNCGATWTSIYLKGGTQLSTTGSDANTVMFVPTSVQWRRDTIDISSLTANQGVVMFSFINRGHFGQPIYLDNINLVFPTPSVSISTPAQLCTNTPFNFLNSSYGVGAYNWNMPGSSPATSTSSNPTLSYAAAGLYSVNILMTNGTTTVSATRTVNIVAPPVITVNTPTVCPGNVAVLTASGAATWSWASGPATASLSATPLSTSFYTVTGTSNGCPTVKVATIVVSPAPVVTVNNATLCSGNSAVLTASGATSYNWTSGPNTASLSTSPLSTTVYTVTGNNGICGTAQTATVFVTTTPTVAVNSLSVCQGSSTVLIATGAGNYLWSTTAVTNTISVSPASTTVYTVTGSNTANALTCNDLRTVTVTVLNTPVVSISASTSSVCTGGSVTLSTGGATTYNWSTGGSGTLITVNPTQSTTYSVIGTTGLCSAISVTSITVVQAPVLSILPVPPTSVCAGSSLSLTASGNFTSFAWTNPSVINGNTIVLTPTQSGIFGLNGYNSNNCNNSTSFSITVKANPVSSVSTGSPRCDQPCSGTVSAQSSGGTGPYNYSLTTGNCNLPCTSLCAGAYTLVTTDAAGCVSNNGFTIVPPVNTLSATISGSNSSCANCSDGAAAITLSGGTSPYSYSWTPASATQSLSSGLPAGCYTVTGTDAMGCSLSTSTCIAAANGTNTGIASQNASTDLVLIYPNPAQQMATIEWQAADFTYSLWNSLGQLIRQPTEAQNKTTVQLNDLAKGIYYLELKSGDLQVRKKLIVD